jgi:hypothetical protein
MHPWRHQASPKRIFLDEALDEFRADSEVVEKRVSFGGRAEPEDLFALIALASQELQALRLLAADVLREASIGFQLVRSIIILGGEHHFESRADCLLPIVSDKANDRTAVDWRQIAIEHLEPVALEQRLNGRQVVVEEMLVIDLIERKVLYDLFHVEKLHYEDAIPLETFPNAVGDGVQLLEMKKHTRCADHIELAI